MVRDDSLDGLLVLTADFDQRIASLREGALKFYFKIKDEQGIKKRRILNLLTDYREKLLNERFQNQNLDRPLLSVLAVDESNLATEQEKLGSMIGGFLPSMELKMMTALIPILNISLATKAIIAGTIKTALLLIVYISSAIYAFANLAVCARFFDREEILFAILFPESIGMGFYQPVLGHS